MNEIHPLAVALFLISPLVSAFSQIILKRSADDASLTGIRYYLNIRVIFAYALFFGCMLLNIWAYSLGMQLSLGTILESSGYLYVMLLSALFLKEKITRRKLIGNALIVLGIVLALTLPF